MAAANAKPQAPPAGNDDIVDDSGQPLGTAAAHDDVVNDSGLPIGLSGRRQPTAPIAAASGTSGPSTSTDLNIPPGVDTIARVGGDVLTGVGKGTARQLTGAMKVVKGAATGDFGPFDQPGRDGVPGPQEEIQAGLHSDNAAQTVGGIGGEMLPYMLPSGWVNAGAEAVKGASVATRLGATMWREALADAGVAYLGSGGDAKTAAVTGVAGGLVRGAASTPLFLRDGKLAQQYLDAATQYGIPITKAEQTQSAVGKLVESMVRRSVGGFRRFAKFDVERNTLLKNVADKIVSSVDPAAMDTRSMGVFVKGSIDQVREAAGQELGQAADQIFSGPAGKLTLDLGKVDANTGQFVPGELAKAAQAIIDSRSLDKLHRFLGGAGGNTDALSQAYGLLQRVAKPYDVIEDPVAAALGYGEGKIVPRKLDVATAKELRTMLFDMTNFSDSTVGKGAIKRLNNALHDSLVDTLDKGGFPQEAAAWETASTNYKQTLQKIEADVLKPLVDRDMPETVARVLNSGNGESAAIALSGILKPPQMARVRGAMASEMVNGALDPNGLFMVNNFKRSIDNLGDTGMKALYGPQLAAELTKFAAAAERFKIVPGTLDTAEGMRLPFMAQLRIAAYAGSAPGWLLAAGSKPGMVAAGAAMGMGAAEIGGGAILAKMMTRPSVVHDLTRALTVDPMTTLGKQLTARIGAYATQAATELRQERASKDATNKMRQEMFGLPPKP